MFGRTSCTDDPHFVLTYLGKDGHEYLRSYRLTNDEPSVRIVRISDNDG